MRLLPPWDGSCFKPEGPGPTPALPFPSWASAVWPTSLLPGTWDPNRATGSTGFWPHVGASRGDVPVCAHGRAGPCFGSRARLPQRLNLVFQSSRDQARGPGRALICSLRPTTGSGTSGEPQPGSGLSLSTPRRPQRGGSRRFSPRDVVGLLGLGHVRSPAGVCVSRQRPPQHAVPGLEAALGLSPASQSHSPPDPRVQMSPTSSGSSLAPTPCRHMGTLTDRDTQTCSQTPGRCFFITLHVASAIKFFN